MSYVKRYRVRAERNGLPKSRREYRISLPYLIVLFRAPISQGTNLQLVVPGYIHLHSGGRDNALCETTEDYLLGRLRRRSVIGANSLTILVNTLFSVLFRFSLLSI